MRKLTFLYFITVSEQTEIGIESMEMKTMPMIFIPPSLQKLVLLYFSKQTNKKDTEAQKE